MALDLLSNKEFCENFKYGIVQIDPVTASTDGILSVANGHTTSSVVPDMTYLFTVAGSGASENHLVLTAQSGNPTPAVPVLDIDPATGDVVFSGSVNFGGISSATDVDIVTTGGDVNVTASSDINLVAQGTGALNLTSGSGGIVANNAVSVPNNTNYVAIGDNTQQNTYGSSDIVFRRGGLSCARVTANNAGSSGNMYLQAGNAGDGNSYIIFSNTDGSGAGASIIPSTGALAVTSLTTSSLTATSINCPKSFSTWTSSLGPTVFNSTGYNYSTISSAPLSGLSGTYMFQFTATLTVTDYPNGRLWVELYDNTSSVVAGRYEIGLPVPASVLSEAYALNCLIMANLNNAHNYSMNLLSDTNYATPNISIARGDISYVAV